MYVKILKIFIVYKSTISKKIQTKIQQKVVVLSVLQKSYIKSFTNGTYPGILKIIVGIIKKLINDGTIYRSILP